MWPQWSNTLSWWQWSLLAAVPPAIVALYFLKLRRRPLEVPSTYLWRRSIEDLHVNSIWQRLRRNLLLFLQLLAVGAAMIALLRPGWQGTRLSGGRYIFLIDNSASMSATDVAPSRLEIAKQRVLELIDEMESGDHAMVVSFSDAAHVEQMYTDNRVQLRRRVEAIGPTQRLTSIREALNICSGLANPSQSAFEATDNVAAAPLPAKMFILSDGRFADVTDFALQNLYANDKMKPVFIPIGEATAANAGVVSIAVQREEQPEAPLQAFVGVQNANDLDVLVDVEVSVNEGPPDVKQLSISAGNKGGVVFDLGDLAEGVVSARLTSLRAKDETPLVDALIADDQAWAVFGQPRRAKVVVVTPGNLFLEKAFSTARSQRLAEITLAATSILKQEAFLKDASTGVYDLVVYDRCVPDVNDDAAEPLKKMPQANTLFLGTIPSGSARWQSVGKVSPLAVVDVDATHPLTELVDLEGIFFDEGTPLALPKDSGVRGLVESTHGALLAIAPRGGYEDAVLAAEIVSEKDGEQYFRTNWWQRQSFPVFWGRVLTYLGRTEAAATSPTVRPGGSIELRATSVAKEISVITPNGTPKPLLRGPLGTFHFADTHQIGVYTVKEHDQTTQRFAVNLASAAESDIRPRGGGGSAASIRIGHEEFEGQTQWDSQRRETWKYLLMAVLVIAGVEWYIYNRRVYL
jgi:Mg-chelatase subunit ChlD